MRRLNLAHAPEKGVVAVLLSVFFGFGVLLGAAALTVDVGNLNAERRQVQNGADASSLAAARLCADGNCPAATTPELTNLANANAADMNTFVQRLDPTQPAVCGSDPKGALSACTVSSPDVKDLTECPPAAIPAGAKGWLRVYTKTKLADGSTVLPYYFAQTLSGAFQGGTQQTCASTAWGPVGGYGAVVPITISLCQWEQFTTPVAPATEPRYQAAPDGPKPGYYTSRAPNWPPSSEEKTVRVQKDDSGCLLKNGNASPGGFGWVTDGSRCSLVATAGQWVQVKPGTSPECDLTNFWETPILIPVFDCIAASKADPVAPNTCANPAKGGTNTYFRIVGYASFYLSGYSIGKCNGSTLLCEPAHWGSTCTASQACLFGWFTKGTLLDAPIGDGKGKDLGISSIQVIG